MISRLQVALEGGGDSLRRCVIDALASLTRSMAKTISIAPQDITAAAIVGETLPCTTCLLGIDPAPLVTPPYMPRKKEAMELPAETLLPTAGTVRILPNIAGL